MVITHTHAKNQGRLIENLERKWMDRRKRAIALPLVLTQSVKTLVKFCCAVFELCEQTDRQTDRQTYSSQYFAVTNQATGV